MIGRIDSWPRKLKGDRLYRCHAGVGKQKNLKVLTLWLLLLNLTLIKRVAQIVLVPGLT